MASNFEISDPDFNNCLWVPVSNLAASKNRLYFYGINLQVKDEPEGVLAIDIMEDGTHKFPWKVADNARLSNIQRYSSVREDDPVCAFPDDLGPQYDLPPFDITLQSIATPEGLICFTTGIGLMEIVDHGTSGEQVYAYLSGNHFLTYAPPVNSDKEGKVWMSGWAIYPPWRDVLLATNSTAQTVGLTPVEVLNITTMNVTSQMMTFNDPNDKAGQKIIVFGAEVQMNHSNTFSYKSILLAVQTTSKDDYHPKVLWTVDLPKSPVVQEEDTRMLPPERSRFIVKGQIVGSNNMIIFYMSDGVTGQIFSVA